VKTHRQILAVAAVSAATLGLSACSGDSGSGAGASSSPTASAGTIPQPPLGKLKKLPVAPDSERVDLAQPTFSNPTRVTNPLFPISRLRSALLLGAADGKPLRVETTLLPYRKTIAWNGRRFKALESQYVAYLDGRIHEVALDWYAQADDGSVWYLGEDVFNYEDGVVADTEGTWLAGREGPPAMIMPAHPRVGDVYRPENAPGVVFEEVTVKSVGKTVDGPRGPVDGAIVVEELHQDGKLERKTFAPGYGEFLTGGGGDLEAIALAVPTDALAGPPPAELETLTSGADDAYDAARSNDWKAASAAAEQLSTAWDARRAGDVPGRLETQMSDALDALSRAVGARKPHEAGHAALDVAEAGLDLELRYRPPARIDLARFELRARRLLLDAAAGDAAAVTGDVTVLDWIRDRLTLGKADARLIDDQLRYLEAAAEAEELEAVSRGTRVLIVISSGAATNRVQTGPGRSE
jgi:hypothetical protein